MKGQNIMKLHSIFFSLLLLFTFFSHKFASAQVTQEWARIYNESEPSSMVIDNSENIYVIGYISGSGTGRDFSTIKYNSNGDLLWVRTYNGSANGDDRATQIAIDNQGNIYVTGFSAGIGTGASDYTTIKYNTNGDSLWVQRYNGPGNSGDSATSLVIDALNNIYVTGYSGGSGTGNDYATIKYNSNGDLIWVRRYNGPGNGIDQAKSIAIDSSENIYVTGFSAGVGTGTSDYATIKYNSLGDLLWVKRYNGSANGDDQANSLTIDTATNIYVTGYSAGTGTGSRGYVTIKYNSNGDSIWVRSYGNSVDRENSIRVDNSGNIYVGGSNFVIKYSPSGVQQWAERYNGPFSNNDEPYSLTLDKRGNIYVTGVNSPNGNGNLDFTTVKYSQVITQTNTLSNGLSQPFNLYQNYPNPFNPNTVISYQLPVSSFVKIKVYDVLGNEVATLVNEKQNAGSYSVEFDAGNYPSGIYYYKLEAGDFSEVKKMILLK